MLGVNISMKGRKRGPDKTKRKKRIYPITTRVQLKLSPKIIQWVRLNGKGRTSQWIEQVLQEKLDEEQQGQLHSLPSSELIKSHHTH